MKKYYTFVCVLLAVTFITLPFNTTNVSAKKKATTTIVTNGIEVYNTAMPSVVHITHNNGGGTGFFIESKRVLTNYHVIKEAEEFEMVDMNGKSYTANYILGYSEELDLAVIETKEKGHPIKMNTHDLTPGETVYALGCPYAIPFVISQGLLGKTSWTIDTKDTIMHTAPISSGNSGGPLVNMYGEVIGVNTLSISGEDAQCLNFAVKIEELSKVSLDNPISIKDWNNRFTLSVNVVEISKAHVGDYVVLGKYEQDNNTKNGAEDIEWLVLAEKDNNLLVVSRYCLDITCWNSNNDFVDWKESEHRNWLNNTFYKNAFSSAEKKKISTSATSSSISTPTSKSGDHIFLLSLEEIDTYFTSEASRRAEASEYCKSLGAGSFGTKYTFWSTRSSSTSEEGKYFTIAVFGDVTSDNPDGTSIVGRMATRPAMWISK